MTFYSPTQQCTVFFAAARSFLSSALSAAFFFLSAALCVFIAEAWDGKYRGRLLNKQGFSPIKPTIRVF